VASASLIVSQEARRVFGKNLPRDRKAPTEPSARGRKPTPESLLLREQLQEDKEAGGLRDASHYVRWLVAQRGVDKGLKQLRPTVYRELRMQRDKQT
jgi:hypothetical protein